MAHTYDTTSNEHQALSLTVRTPTSSVADHTVWEKHSNKTSDCLMVVSGVHHLTWTLPYLYPQVLPKDDNLLESTKQKLPQARKRVTNSHGRFGVSLWDLWGFWVLWARGKAPIIPLCSTGSLSFKHRFCPKAKIKQPSIDHNQDTKKFQY